MFMFIVYSIQLKAHWQTRELVRDVIEQVAQEGEEMGNGRGRATVRPH